MTEETILILKSLNLLYVEDNKRLLDEVKSVFNDLFHNTFTASDGCEALEVLKKEKIDIIITDINMPNKNGIELIKEIRDIDKKISIIILTAHADADILFEATNLQIDGYLTKPINFDKIITALSNSVKRSNFSTNYILNDGSIYNYSLKNITTKDEVFKLGKKESMLIDFLILNSEKTTTKDELIYHIWNGEDITESALKNLISNLRTKIGKENIVNYSGQGWQIILRH